MSLLSRRLATLINRSVAYHKQLIGITSTGHNYIEYNQRGYAIAVGDKASLIKRFSQQDVTTFANISGDVNPLHIDAEFAKTTRFGKPIVHGVLTLGLISGILGTKLPGKGGILLHYEAKYPAPLFVGEEATAEVEVTEINKRKVTFRTEVTETSTGKVVLTGTTSALVPREALQ